MDLEQKVFWLIIYIFRNCVFGKYIKKKELEDIYGNGLNI